MTAQITVKGIVGMNPEIKKVGDKGPGGMKLEIIREGQQESSQKNRSAEQHAFLGGKGTAEVLSRTPGRIISIEEHLKHRERSRQPE